MIRLLVIDGCDLFREGIKRVLKDVSDIQVADETDSEDDALNKIHDNKYDVLLLDISMVSKIGLGTLKKIKSENPKLPVLALNLYTDKEFAIRALKLGASGYFTKDIETNELITAIRKVATGKKYISANLASMLASHLNADSSNKPHTLLTNQELHIMQMLCTGKPQKKIAKELSLSTRTISLYKAKILEKMKMKSNTDLIKYALSNLLFE